MTNPAGVLRHGLFMFRYISGGPWVPAQVFFGPPMDPVTGQPLDRRPRWQAIVGGELSDECCFGLEDRGGDFIWRILMSHEIDAATYKSMTRDAEWARAEAPGLPEANPRQRIRLGRMAPLF